MWVIEKNISRLKPPIKKCLLFKWSDWACDQMLIQRVDTKKPGNRMFNASRCPLLRAWQWYFTRLKMRPRVWQQHQSQPENSHFSLKGRAQICMTSFYSWLRNRVQSTVTIWIPDKSDIQMVQMCPVVKLSGFWMVAWKPDKKCLFYGQNAWFSNGLPYHAMRPFENWTKFRHI